MTAQPALDRIPAPRPFHWHMRGTLGTTFVAALYVMLLVASPLLVRFAPMPDNAIVASVQAAAPAADSRCGSTPESGRACDVHAPGE
ncbi:MAG: hypothetical protein U1F48_20305 [Burkholderiales bacterium]